MTRDRLWDLYLAIRWRIIGWESHVYYWELYTMAIGSFAIGGIYMWAALFVLKSNFSRWVSRKTPKDN